MNADELIFAEPVPPSRTPAEWDAIVERLTSTLAATLGLAVTVDYRAVIDDVALTCRVMTTEPAGGPLRLGITATIGLDIIQQRPCVDATVLVFSGDKRIGPGVDGVSTFSYQRGGRWHTAGWQHDEYGEYRGWPAPRFGR